MRYSGWGMRVHAVLVAAVVVLCVGSVAGAAPKVPEKLVYELSWAGVPVDTATQEVADEGDVRTIVSTARSNDWLDRKSVV